MTRNTNKGRKLGPLFNPDPAEFVRVWQAADSRAAVAEHFNTTLGRVTGKGIQLRKAGVRLKRLFPEAVDGRGRSRSPSLDVGALNEIVDGGTEQ